MCLVKLVPATPGHFDSPFPTFGGSNALELVSSLRRFTITNDPGSSYRIRVELGANQTAETGLFRLVRARSRKLFPQPASKSSAMIADIRLIDVITSNE